MARTFTVRVSDDFDILRERLALFPDKMERRIMRGALRAGGVVFRNAARKNLDAAGAVKTRNLRDSVRVTLSTYRETNPEAMIKAGRRVTRKQRGRGARDVFYAHIVERGARRHFIRLSEELRPTNRSNRRGAAVSIRTANRMLARGSLKIGTRFVGASVVHPGYVGRAYMARARQDSQAQAVQAFRDYASRRIADYINKGAEPEETK